MPKYIKIFKANVIAIATNRLRLDTFGEAKSKEIWHLIISLVRSCHAKYYQTVPSGLKLKAFFTNWLRLDMLRRGFFFFFFFFCKKKTKHNGIWQFHWISFVNMYLHAKTYQNFPKPFKSSSDFQKLIVDGRTCLGEDIYEKIWHLTILVRSCQYVRICQNYQNVLSGLKVVAITDWRTDMVIKMQFSLSCFFRWLYCKLSYMRLITHLRRMDSSTFTLWTGQFLKEGISG